MVTGKTWTLIFGGEISVAKQEAGQIKHSKAEES